MKPNILALIIIIFLYTLENAGLFLHKVGSNMDKTKCWVKM